MMGVFSLVCSGVLWGIRESAVSDSGRRHCFFFWVGGIGNGKRRRRGPWSSSYVHCMSRPQTDQNFMYLCSVLCLILYKQSLVVSLMDYRHVLVRCVVGARHCCATDGMCTTGSATRRVSFYASLVGGGLRLSGPSSGSNGSVRVYRSCMRTLCS
jgi:hypothetical protein